MAQALPQPVNCCSTCEDPISTAIPGPQGDPGADCVPCNDGENAYTLLSASFTMPAELDSDTADVESSNSFVIGEIVAMEFMGVASPNNFGYFEVAGKPSATQLSLKNLKDTPNAAYMTNAAPGTIAPSGSLVSHGGLQGPAGAVNSLSLLRASNLSDVASTATSRSNLGLGTMAVQNANNVAITGGTIAGVTVSGISVGGDLVGNLPNPTLAASGVVAGTYGTPKKVPQLTLDAKGRVTAVAEVETQALPFSGLLGGLLIDLNTTADQAIPIVLPLTHYVVRRLVVTAATVDLSASPAAGGVYNAPGKPGGGKITDAAQVYTALSTANKFLDLTLVSPGTTDRQSAANLYFSLSSPHGVAANAYLSIFGDGVQ